MSAEPSTLPMRRLAPFALALSLGACDWFTDFKDQPRIEPWESYALADSAGNIDTTVSRRIPFRGQPQQSVPVTGSVAPGYWVSYQPLPTTVDSMSGLANPTAATEASLRNGRLHYQINCAVCHGMAGAGNGPVTKYGLPAPSLLTANALGLSDGYLFGIIRNGRGLMPNYNRIEEPDRWDVVNYVRALQGRFPADTTPMAAPGVGGPAVPGYTRTAPTRPAPHTVGIGTTGSGTGATVGGQSPLGTGAQPVPGAPPAGAQEPQPRPGASTRPPTTTPPDTSAQPRERL